MRTRTGGASRPRGAAYSIGVCATYLFGVINHGFINRFGFCGEKRDCLMNRKEVYLKILSLGVKIVAKLTENFTRFLQVCYNFITGIFLRFKNTFLELIY